MESELTQFQKFQKIFGVNMDRLLAFFKWVKFLMVTQTMLVTTKTM
jgi:hypothetical protein